MAFGQKAIARSSYPLAEGMSHHARDRVPGMVSQARATMACEQKASHESPNLLAEGLRHRSLRQRRRNTIHALF
ncbi:hypothetical protein CGZ80_13165 [Rhodopirellula sp. MGV]|nr:hypothetical protein CGZ80_13165 [Rhodopirellula sp. MGV]PNY38141.1 hypothetical protein C2E31_03785 [Rhodopirellula baltica]